MFIPSGVPVLLLPFLVIIEIISHLAKIFSLSIRLFANMMSGHVLLHILTGFVLDLAKANFLFIIAPLALIMSIVLLEYGIACLQAYVFITLMAIYFEEHFGFAQKDSNKVSKLITVNGTRVSLVKKSFEAMKMITKLDDRKYLHFLWVDKLRKKRGRNTRKKFWRYSIMCRVYVKKHYHGCNI